MSEVKEFKILSIDGGGIKGLYASTILRHLEEKFNCRISDYFDLLCGTSTGGLIALALSQKITAERICSFYVQEGPKIFPKTGKTAGFLKQALWKGKYSDRHLKQALASIFGNKLIGDSHNLLCIPSYSITHADNIVFKYDHAEGDLSRDNKLKYVDVALATSAAPTYFPVAEIGAFHGGQFIDGGVWGNNPTLVALIEALKYFVTGDRFNKIRILSISCINLYEGKPKVNRNRSFRHWQSALFQTSITGQSSFVNYFMESITESLRFPVDYVRIPSEKVSAGQEHLIQLDVATGEALNMILALGDRAAEIQKKRPEIMSFFDQKKLYTI
jgi:hypothetical protein